MNKSHAMMYLVMEIGRSDGEWTGEEMRAALNGGHLSAALDEAPDWAEKIKSSELNYKSSIDIMNQLSKEEQMKCLVTCLITARADGELDPAEVNVLSRFMVDLNKGITVKELFSAL